MDIDTQHTPGRPSTGDVEHIHASATTDGIPRVFSSAREVEVINCSDVESCDMQRHLLGDSTDGDSDDNDVGVNSGVALPATHPSAGGGSAPTLNCVPTASTDAVRLSTPVADEFYNAARKAPTPSSLRRSRDGGQSASSGSKRRPRKRPRPLWSCSRSKSGLRP